MLSAMKQDFAGFDASVQRLAQAEAVLDTLERQARKTVRALEAVEGEND